MKQTLRIGARASQLSLKQAGWVAEQLRAHHRGLHVEIVTVSTTGDKDQNRPLSTMGVTGIFTREVDNALLDGRVDLSVHSLKDLPTTPTQGLSLCAVPIREDPRDAFLSLDGRTLREMEPDAQIGTSSVRREAQLRLVRNDLQILPLRGNVDTRIRKLRDEKQYDGIILAYAGLKRLGRENEATEILELEHWLPAPGQGALALVVRDDDEQTRGLVETLDDPNTHSTVLAERSLLQALEAGCHVPVGAYASITGETLKIDAFIASADGKHFIRKHNSGTPSESEALGRRLAQRLSEAIEKVRQS